MSLRLRLALFGAAVVALTLLLFGTLVYVLISHSATTNQDTALLERALQATSQLNGSELAPRAPVAPAELRSSTEIFVEVFDRQWSLVYTTAVLNGSPPPVDPRLRSMAEE